MNMREQKAVKQTGDWRRRTANLRSEPDASLLHLIEPTVLETI